MKCYDCQVLEFDNKPNISINICTGYEYLGCGNAIYDGYKYCSYCSEELGLCERCGKEIVKL